MTTQKMNQLFEEAQYYGVQSLPTEELFALLLLGTPRNREKIVTHLQTLLISHDGIAGMLNMDLCELVGDAFDTNQATRLQALLEVTRRLLRQTPDRKYQIRCVDDAARLVIPEMRYLTVEQIRVLVLDTKNQVLANLPIYQGTANSAVLRAAEVYRPAVVRNSPNIIICHNHPSGDPEPSPEDIEVTKQCLEAGKVLDIELLDHIIIGNPRYVSLKERMRW